MASAQLEDGTDYQVKFDTRITLVITCYFCSFYLRVQHFVRFNPSDVRDIVTNGEKNIIFWVWYGN